MLKRLFRRPAMRDVGTWALGLYLRLALRTIRWRLEGAEHLAPFVADALAAGGQVVITPDGPRGPRRVAAPGVGHLAAMSGVMVMPCAAQSWPRLMLGSWDRMVLPLPFGRGVLVCGAPIAVAADAAEAGLPRIAAAMTAAAEAADRAVG